MPLFSPRGLHVAWWEVIFPEAGPPKGWVSGCQALAGGQGLADRGWQRLLSLSKPEWLELSWGVGVGEELVVHWVPVGFDV